MTFSARLSGTLEVAAALAFHLPGTRLDLSSPNGAQCSVGPLTDPRCSLHPAEFRELVMVAGAGGLLGSMLGYELEDNPQISLAAAEGVEHLGGGLYQVTGRDSVSFAFATTLQASHVDAVLSDGYLSELNAGRDREPASGRDHRSQPHPGRRARSDAGGDLCSGHGGASSRSLRRAAGGDRMPGR